MSWEFEKCPQCGTTILVKRLWNGAIEREPCGHCLWLAEQDKPKRRPEEAGLL